MAKKVFSATEDWCLWVAQEEAKYRAAGKHFELTATYSYPVGTTWEREIAYEILDAPPIYKKPSAPAPHESHAVPPSLTWPFGHQKKGKTLL